MEQDRDRAVEPAPGSVAVTADGTERTFAPVDTPVLIGRDSTCDVVVDNKNVSRRHVELRHIPGGWQIHDLDSRQGTFLDGEPIVEAALLGHHEVSLGVPGVGVSLSVRAPGNVTADPLPAVPPPAAPPSPPAQDRPAPRPEGTIITSGPRLRVECAGRSYDFGASDDVVVGRSADSDVVASNPSVSRRHARLAFGPNGWQLEDLGSSGGTFVDGSRVVGPRRLSGTTEVFLGDASSGERLLVVAPGASAGSPSSTPAAASLGRRSRAWLAVVGAVAVIGVIAVVGALLLSSNDGSPGLDQLARATVRIEVQTQDDGVLGGSGTIIDAERGLILTNAHVVAPDAPGLEVLYENPAFGLSAADEIVVDVAPGLDEAAEPSFRGEVVAVDGYLDVAVVQLTRRLSGALLEDGDLDGLEEVALGDSDDVSTGETLRILGYPDVSDSNAPNLTSGVVSSFIQDDRLATNRAFLNVSAEIAAGNSGGLAVDDNGRIVGIPTLTRFSGTDEANRIRPISFAMAVIDAAVEGEEYESPNVTELGDEPTASITASVVPASSPGFRTECSSATEGLRDGAGALALSFEYSGFGDGPHQDVLVEVLRTSGDRRDLIGSVTSASEHPVAFGPTGCAEATVNLTEPLASGDYELLIWAGPSYDLLEVVEVTVG